MRIFGLGDGCEVSLVHVVTDAHVGKAWWRLTLRDGWESVEVVLSYSANEDSGYSLRRNVVGVLNNARMTMTSFLSLHLLHMRFEDG